MHPLHLRHGQLTYNSKTTEQTHYSTIYELFLLPYYLVIGLLMPPRESIFGLIVPSFFTGLLGAYRCVECIILSFAQGS